MKLRVYDGAYFFHKSFLLEISNKWITKKETCEGAELLMALVKAKMNDISSTFMRIKLISCDRTFEELEKSKHKIAFVPGVFDFIEKESLNDGGEFKDDEYALKVSSLKGIAPYRTYFVVLNALKTRMERFAKRKGYKSIIVCCPLDFEINLY